MRKPPARHASGVTIKDPSNTPRIMTSTLAALVASMSLVVPASAATLNKDGSLTVESGDTLSQMAQDYGNGDWSKARGFKSGNPNLIFPGDIITGIDKMANNIPVATTTELRDLAKDVIAGKFGNGDERRAALGSKYDSVQAIVNDMLGVRAPAAAGATSVNPLASNKPVVNKPVASKPAATSKPAAPRQWIIDKPAWTEYKNVPQSSRVVRHPARGHWA